MRIKKAKTLWLILAVAPLCLGWADSWKQIQTMAGTVTSVQADFVQAKHLPILAKPLISKGAFYYEAPHSLRWEYCWPVRSILLMHDGNVRRFVGTGGKAGFSEESGGGLQAMQVVMEDISQWLKGRFNGNGMFQTRLEPGRRIILAPKSKAFRKVIQRIVLNLGKRPGVIRSVAIYESKDAYTLITFSHTVLNAKIPASLFEKVS